MRDTAGRPTAIVASCRNWRRASFIAVASQDTGAWSRRARGSTECARRWIVHATTSFQCWANALRLSNPASQRPLVQVWAFVCCGFLVQVPSQKNEADAQAVASSIVWSLRNRRLFTLQGWKAAPREIDHAIYIHLT